MNLLADKEYKDTLKLLIDTILKSRIHAARVVNMEMLKLYWFTGGVISHRAKHAKWGDKILDQLSEDIQIEMPGLKGFSAQNIKKCVDFMRHGRFLLNLVQQCRTNYQFPASQDLVQQCRTKFSNTSQILVLQTIS